MSLRPADGTTSHSTKLSKNDSQVAGYRDRLIIGLTGGIGSGKTTVAALFAEYGAGIIDTDVIAHHLTQAGGAAIAAIRAAFGDDYLTGDGALDRAKMRGLIFSDAAARQRLEQILHPMIFEQTKAQLRQLQDKPYILAVVPLLPESRNFRQLVQRVLVVDCDEDTQVARVVGRSRLTEAEVRAIIVRQTPRADRLQLADDVIRNDAGLDSLAGQVAVLHEYYAKMQNSD
ncbi:dephospho-CoA kinase [Candidatus Ferrigenium straubiae]|jgi:dephospho-CoA kinase|uniref:dephospho-CoA kinase n=1 Tax=Candidatus Ferrigenium straubiae TaxID=2919506 RepID=UPI003F4AEEEC